MARPAKATKTMAKNLTADERAARLETEESLKGSADNIRPPKFLSGEQKRIFRKIVMELKEAGILGNLDVYILSTAAVSIDRIQSIEQQINADPKLLSDRDFMSSKEKYSRDFYRCCNELCLSPQARAKLAGLRVQKEKGENPLLKALRDTEDE